MAQTPSHRFRIDPSDMESSAVDRRSSTTVRNRQPENVVRTLKMPLLRADVDDRQQVSVHPSQEISSQLGSLISSPQQASVGQAKKKQARPATVVEQLKHCLGQYELLQKQLLCAELTGTTSSDDRKFERTATLLISRITKLRKQLAAQSDPVQNTMAPESDLNRVTARPAGDPVATKTSPGTANRKSVSGHSKRVIKLSVSHSIAMVLKAFADAGKRPSSLVERALWADPDVQDAALLLKLKAPTK
ncbi:MAG: hypothetical protein ABJZ55_00950 [Fuerstiella sp.]